MRRILALLTLLLPVTLTQTNAQSKSLDIWTRFNTDNPQVLSDEWLAGLLGDYSDDTNRAIENTFYPFDQINATLNIAVQTRTNIPDAAYIDTEQISFFYNNGVLTDLTNFVESAAWYDDLDAASLATCTAPDGTILCVPSTTSHYYVYYWTDAYPDGFPATTDEFLVTAADLRATGLYPLTYKAAEPVSVERFYTGLLRSYGVELAGANGEATWATDEAVEAVTFVRELFASGYVPPVALAPQFEYEEPFKAGKAAAFVAGTFSYVYLSPLTSPDGTRFDVEITGSFDTNAVAIGAAADTGALGFAPPLAAPGGVPVSIISSEAWAVPSGARDVEGALAFIDYQMTTERNADAAVAGGKLPVLDSAAATDTFASGYWSAALEIRENYGAPAPTWSDYNSAQRLLSEAIVTAITNPNANIMTELQRAQDEYNLLVK